MNLISVLKEYPKKYSFLIQQLVSRDFKTKYKRSFLGILWSLLNPLLTTIVQYFVFSTIFDANTENYPIYLISGVVCFNYFADATNQAMMSIVSNGNLIKKVYLPKYIFPFTKCISSSINMLISLIPLLFITLLFGLKLKWPVLFIFYFLLCLAIFSFGVGLILSATNVYFRDIQFLWTVIIQIWSYATPIFYPAEIIPESYFWLMRINPLYHIIGNLRKCLINGIMPPVYSFLICALFALISLLIGLLVFKKTQDKFVLNL